jgi:hypothetical protein
MHRRLFLHATIAGLTAAPRPPRILLRSSWQVVNIGDVAHTPGVITLLERYIPQAEITLWPSSLAQGVEPMLRRRFPKLKIVSNQQERDAAIAASDFLLHGSGPYLVSPDAIELWRTATGKPYGVYGITLPPNRLDDRIAGLLTGAKFVFFRDTESLKFAQSRGVASPIMDFGPDGAFGTDLRNDAAAKAFLAEHSLKPNQFLCCIPRYRNTPGWRMLSKVQPVQPDIEADNQATKVESHEPLRVAITRLVREQKRKVLICPEDETQIQLGKDVLYDLLPDDVKPSVVWRDRFWLTDEALSTYALSDGVFGFEMHSPIMCIGNGIPAIVCRWTEQTTKGYMWRDIGLNDWLFNTEVKEEVARIVPAVLAMSKDPVAARKKAAAARKVVNGHQKATMDVLLRHLP